MLIIAFSLLVKNQNIFYPVWYWFAHSAKTSADICNFTFLPYISSFFETEIDFMRKGKVKNLFVIFYGIEWITENWSVFFVSEY